MAYEWDPEKADANVAKHGIHFPNACIALEDDNALTFEDESAGEERRWVSLGLDDLGRVLVVVYTWRGSSIRLISARTATKRERKDYEKR